MEASNEVHMSSSVNLFKPHHAAATPIGIYRELTKTFRNLRTSYATDIAPRKQALKRFIASNDKLMLRHLLLVKPANSHASLCSYCGHPLRLAAHLSCVSCSICHESICNSCRREIRALPTSIDSSKEFLIVGCPSCYIFTKGLHWLYHPSSAPGFGSEFLELCEESCQLNTKLCTAGAQIEGLMQLALSVFSDSFALNFCQNILIIKQSLEASLSRLMSILKQVSEEKRFSSRHSDNRVRINLMIYIQKIIKRERPHVSGVEKQLQMLAKQYPTLSTALLAKESESWNQSFLNNDFEVLMSLTNSDSSQFAHQHQKL